MPTLEVHKVGFRPSSSVPTERTVRSLASLLARPPGYLDHSEVFPTAPVAAGTMVKAEATKWSAATETVEAVAADAIDHGEGADADAAALSVAAVGVGVAGGVLYKQTERKKAEEAVVEELVSVAIVALSALDAAGATEAAESSKQRLTAIEMAVERAVCLAALCDESPVREEAGALAAGLLAAASVKLAAQSSSSGEGAPSVTLYAGAAVVSGSAFDASVGLLGAAAAQEAAQRAEEERAALTKAKADGLLTEVATAAAQMAAEAGRAARLAIASHARRPAEKVAEAVAVVARSGQSAEEGEAAVELPTEIRMGRASGAEWGEAADEKLAAALTAAAAVATHNWEQLTGGEARRAVEQAAAAAEAVKTAAVEAAAVEAAEVDAVVGTKRAGAAREAASREYAEQQRKEAVTAATRAAAEMAAAQMAAEAASQRAAAERARAELETRAAVARADAERLTAERAAAEMAIARKDADTAAGARARGAGLLDEKVTAVEQTLAALKREAEEAGSAVTVAKVAGGVAKAQVAAEAAAAKAAAAKAAAVKAAAVKAAAGKAAAAKAAMEEVAAAEVAEAAIQNETGRAEGRVEAAMEMNEAGAMDAATRTHKRAASPAEAAEVVASTDLGHVSAWALRRAAFAAAGAVDKPLSATGPAADTQPSEAAAAEAAAVEGAPAEAAAVESASVAAAEAHGTSALGTVALPKAGTAGKAVRRRSTSKPDPAAVTKRVGLKMLVLGLPLTTSPSLLLNEFPGAEQAAACPRHSAALAMPCVMHMPHSSRAAAARAPQVFALFDRSTGERKAVVVLFDSGRCGCCAMPLGRAHSLGRRRPLPRTPILSLKRLASNFSQAPAQPSIQSLRVQAATHRADPGGGKRLRSRRVGIERQGTGSAGSLRPEHLC